MWTVLTNKYEISLLTEKKVIAKLSEEWLVQLDFKIKTTIRERGCEYYKEVVNAMNESNFSFRRIINAFSMIVVIKKSSYIDGLVQQALVFFLPLPFLLHTSACSSYNITWSYLWHRSRTLEHHLVLLIICHFYSLPFLSIQTIIILLS